MSEKPPANMDDEETKAGGGSTALMADDQVLVDQTNDMNKIFAFGDNMKMLVFNVGQMMWQTSTFDNNSSYDGSLKYMACCATPFQDT